MLALFGAVAAALLMTPPTHALGAELQSVTVHINEGSGTVVSDPAGIECSGGKGTSCEAQFEEGESVTLTVSPAAGYAFNGWQTCWGGVDGFQCTLTVAEAREVGVRFAKAWDLTVSKAAGSEPGIVKALPVGVVCPFRCSSSTYSFKQGQEITISHYEPAKHLRFVELTGGTGSASSCTGSTLSICTFTIEEDSSIEALFEERTEALSLEKEGGGTAAITSEPFLVYCFNACNSASGLSPKGEEVTIHWKLGAGVGSIEWTSGGDTCTGRSEETEGSCTVWMDEPHELVARLE